MQKELSEAGLNKDPKIEKLDMERRRFVITQLMASPIALMKYELEQKIEILLKVYEIVSSIEIGDYEKATGFIIGLNDSVNLIELEVYVKTVRSEVLKRLIGEVGEGIEDAEELMDKFGAGIDFTDIIKEAFITNLAKGQDDPSWAEVAIEIKDGIGYGIDFDEIRNFPVKGYGRVNFVDAVLNVHEQALAEGNDLLAREIEEGLGVGIIEPSRTAVI